MEYELEYNEERLVLRFESPWSVTMHTSHTMYVLTEQESDVVDKLATFQFLAYCFYEGKPRVAANLWLQQQLQKYKGLSFRIAEMEPVNMRCDEVLGPCPTPSVDHVRVRFETSRGQRMHATFVSISKRQFLTVQ